MPWNALELWGTCLGLMLLGTAVLAVLAQLLCRYSRWARDQRTVWRLTLAGFLLIFFLEISGMAGMAASQLSWRNWLPSAPSPLPVPGELFVGVMSPMPEPSSPSLLLWLPAVLWLLGSGLWLGRFCRGHWLLARLRQRLQPANAATFLEAAQLARSLRCGRSVEVGILAGLQGPMVFGIFRPVLALPAHFSHEFTPAQQTAILTHELSHIADRDAAWQLATELATALFWWNPLVWLIRSQLRKASEAAADEATLHLADGPGLLAESLVILGRKLTSRPLLGSWAMADAAGRSQLAQRVDTLLQLEGQPLPTAFQRCCLTAKALLLLVSALLGCLALRSAAAGASWQEHWRQSPLVQTWSALQPTTSEVTGTAVAETAPKRRSTPVRRLISKDSKGSVILAAPLDPQPGSFGELTYVRDVVEVDDGHGGTIKQNVLRSMRNGKLLTEEEIIGKLDLTPDQRERFWALRRELDKDTLELYRMTSGKEKRGQEINRRWREGVQQIMTPDQHRRYLEYWR
jgi:beta-lactamase regulating signal transducer with metallopeptidase domain